MTKIYQDDVDALLMQMIFKEMASIYFHNLDEYAHIVGFSSIDVFVDVVYRRLLFMRTQANILFEALLNRMKKKGKVIRNYNYFTPFPPFQIINTKFDYCLVCKQDKGLCPYCDRRK